MEQDVRYGRVRHIWDEFCRRQSVTSLLVPLFQSSSDLTVVTRTAGRTGRKLLCRSAEMELLVRTQAAKAVKDHTSNGHRIDGLIYMMGWREDQRFIPLYIGKAETTGLGNGNLSANLKGLDRDTSKFARWGDGYSYHIGDLSACVLPEHDPKHQQDKYRDWANTLFEQAPSDAPVLRKPVWFWTTAWDNSTAGIWEDLGPTRLAFLEYTMIGVASMVSKHLSNREGRQRV